MAMLNNQRIYIYIILYYIISEVTATSQVLIQVLGHLFTGNPPVGILGYPISAIL